MNKIENINFAGYRAGAGDYTGEDGLLYCGSAASPKKPISQRARRFSGLTATRQSATARGAAG